MSRVRSSDTTPEMIVRRYVHGLGYRYRLHVRNMIGTPDLVFPRLRCVIDVRGCFWHQHDCPRGRRPLPVTRSEYWSAKLARNLARDAANLIAWRQAGWAVLIVWECETKPRRQPTMFRKVAGFLRRADVRQQR